MKRKYIMTLSLVTLLGLSGSYAEAAVVNTSTSTPTVQTQTASVNDARITKMKNLKEEMKSLALLLDTNFNAKIKADYNAIITINSTLIDSPTLYSQGRLIVAEATVIKKDVDSMAPVLDTRAKNPIDLKKCYNGNTQLIYAYNDYINNFKKASSNIKNPDIAREFRNIEYEIRLNEGSFRNEIDRVIPSLPVSDPNYLIYADKNIGALSNLKLYSMPDSLFESHLEIEKSKVQRAYLTYARACAVDIAGKDTDCVLNQLKTKSSIDSLYFANYLAGTKIKSIVDVYKRSYNIAYNNSQSMYYPSNFEEIVFREYFNELSMRVRGFQIVIDSASGINKFNVIKSLQYGESMARPTIYYYDFKNRLDSILSRYKIVDGIGYSSFAPSYTTITTGSSLTINIGPVNDGMKWRYRISADNGATYGAWSSYSTELARNIVLNATKNTSFKIQREMVDKDGNVTITTSSSYIFIK